MKSRFPFAAQALQNWIAAQKLHPGARLPSSRKIAEELGFTPATMMRACQSLLSIGALCRNGYKLTVAREGATASDIQGVITVVACPQDDAFVRTVQRILAERGVQYRTISTPASAYATLPHVLRKLHSGEKPAGIILRARTVTESIKIALKTVTLPLVVYVDGLHQVSQFSVQMDIYQAIEKSVGHLYELGHRRIAFFSVNHGSTTQEWRDLYQAACLKRGLKAASSTIWSAENYRFDVAHEVLLEGHRRQPDVTALVIRNYFATQVIRTFSVPREISVIGIGEWSLGAARPLLTTVALRDPDALASWACTNLIEQIQTIQLGKPPKTPMAVLFVPELLPGKSTRAIQTKKIPGETRVMSPPPSAHPSRTWRNIYPFLEKNGSNEWRTLDLSKLANHSITRHHGWLGAEPLEHFPPGLRSIHGVPFHVINEKRNRGNAVVTFRSPHSHSAKRKQLPTEARLKVNLQTKAIYFLHGCGYAKTVPFAEYIMHFASGRKSSIPLVPLGFTGVNSPRLSKHLRPNLQDWWEKYEHRDFPHAYHATVCDVTDPTAYERTIYSLEWINPRPSDPVRLIEVQVDAQAGPVLALISITALLYL